jgi:hypothetical protein
MEKLEILQYERATHQSKLGGKYCLLKQEEDYPRRGSICKPIYRLSLGGGTRITNFAPLPGSPSSVIVQP